MCNALQKNACDLVMPDFMRIGGVTDWMRAAQRKRQPPYEFGSAAAIMPHSALLLSFTAAAST